MKTVKAILLCLFFFALGCGITYLCLAGGLDSFGLPAISADMQEKSAAVRKAEEIQFFLDNYFIGEYDETALCDSLAEGMVAGTGDRWSYYVSASELNAYNEQMDNSYEGIGVAIQKQDDGSVLITDVRKESPAFRAGILPGDMIQLIDGVDITGLSLTEVRDLVRCTEEDSVCMQLLRENELITLDVPLAVIETEVSSYEIINGHIGYIIIGNFDSRCAKETISCIEDAISDGADSLLFDVRFNPGGYKDELVEILDYLLPEGILFRMKDYTGRESIDRSDPDCISLPMAVIVNEDTYSAAEFFAVALQEYGVAEIVGAQTSGKGYFQYFYPLSDGSGLSLSSGTYYTPHGVSLAGNGIVPDYPIEISEEDYSRLYYGLLSFEDDLQLQKAVSILEKKG